MLRINHISRMIIPTMLSLFIFSCSAADLALFQVNDYAEYRMFSLLDDYPSLYEAVNSLDQSTVNAYLGDAVNFKTDEFIAMTQGTIDLLNYKSDPDGAGYHEAYPVPEMLKRARKVIARVNEQDVRDKESGFTSFASDFFSFIDYVRDAEIGYEDDILGIMSRGAEYSLEREYADSGYLLKNTEETIANLIDPETLLAANYNQQTMGKLLIQANRNLTVDGSEDIVPDGSGDDIGLGNSARGVGALLKGVIELLENPDVRESIYDVVRELGVMSAAKLSTDVIAYNADVIDYTTGKYATDGFKRLKDVMREEIENKEDFFTEGGVVYSDTGNDLYRRRTATEYADSELRNVSKEQLPHMISLLLRGDRPGAMFADTDQGGYFAERFVTGLSKLNIDWERAHLEESLYDMIRYDTYGRDRTDPGSGSYDISMLEAAMMTGGVTTNLGWLDGGTTSERTYEPNKSHGHGVPAGNITLNDSIFAMKTAPDSLTGDTLYSLGFDHNGRLFRSKDPFTVADANAGKCKIVYDQNYCALNFLATHSVGDVGLPSGGNPNGSTSGLNQFVPYSPSGFNDTNTAAFNMNWVARGCWNGEGPYYFADPNAEITEINGKSYSRHLRANGKTYAYVHKANPDDSSTWEYIYPADQNEPKDVISYIGEMPITNAVYHSSETVNGRLVLLKFSIRIKIGSEINVTVDFGPFATYDIDDVINRINSAINSAAGSTLNLCSSYNTNYLKIVAPAGKTIEISNANNPDTVGDNPVQVFLQQNFEDDEVKLVVPNSFQITGNTIVNVKVDSIDKNITFTAASPDNDGWWQTTEVRNLLRTEIGADYINSSEKCILIEGKSMEDGVAKVELRNVSGSGMVEIFGSVNGDVIRNVVERYHRYRAAWRSDYYMIRMNRGVFSPADMLSGNASEGACFIFDEIIPESEPKRACKSQEEALYRNFQWILTEKKIVLIVPFYINPMGAEFGFFQIVEGNGFEGLVNARKFRDNKYWAKSGSRENSIIPGDYRLYVETTTPGYVLGCVEIGFDKVWGTIGNGSSNPAIIPHTFTSISRLAFPRSEVTNRPANTIVYGNEYKNTAPFLNFSVGSREFEVNDTDMVWKKRNGLVPLVVTLLSTAWEMSDVNHKGILRVLDSQFASLKPLFFYNRSASGVMRQSWLPRIAGSSTAIFDFMRPDADVSGFISSTSDPTGYFGGWNTRNFYQLRSIPTSMTFMVDSDSSSNRSDRTKRADGLLPLLTAYNPDYDRGNDNLPNTRIITELIKLLDKIGDSSYADPDPENVDDNDLCTYGTRRKIFYGAEQYLTTQRIIKNSTTLNLTTIDETNFKNIDFPSWMFTNTIFVDANSDGLHDGTYDDIRPEDIVVDEGLNLSIGSDALDMGMAVYPDRRVPGHPSGKTWYFFNDAADKAVEFTSNLGPGAGKFNVTENLISLIDKIFNNVSLTQNQVNGLVHTLGIVNTEWSDSEEKWLYPSDLIEIQGRYLPTIMDVNKAHLLESAEFNFALMGDGGLITYVLNTMTTPFSTEEIFGDLYRLLGHRQLAKNDAPDSRLWGDLIEMNEGLILSILSRVSPLTFTEMNEFQYNGPYGESIFDSWDPFGDMGNVFSQ